MALIARGLVIAVTAASMAFGCSKRERPVERTEPWRAKPEAAPASLIVEYEIDPSSRATFTASTRKQKNRGLLPVVKGTFEVDLLDLRKARATVLVDVGAVLMSSFEAEAENRSQTQRARNWLDVGPSKPEAQRERLRWAKFTLRSVERTSSRAAYEGTKLKRRRVPADAASDAAGGARYAESRRVSLDALGDLELHSVRVEARAKLWVTFHYEDGASFDAKPAAIDIATRAPLRVSLLAHDIRPRDAKGVVIAEEIPLARAAVGPEASVTLDLRARPAR